MLGAQINRGRVSDPAQAALSGSQNEAPGSAGGNLTFPVNKSHSLWSPHLLARYSGKVQAQEVLSQSSYLSASDPRLHFGLGAATTVDIEIHWPLGLVEKYPALAAGQLVTIREGVGIVKGRPFSRS